MSVNLKNIRKNQRGFAPLLLILLILAVVGVGGFVYWRVSSYNNNHGRNGAGRTTNNSTNNSATLSDECVARTHDANICHLGAIQDLSKYSAEVHVTMKSDTGSLNTIVKFDGKGDTEVDGDIKGITIGSRNYVYMDKWYDTGGDKSQMPSNPVKFGIATTAGIKYENLGKVACGKDTCFNYRMSGGILGDGVVICHFGDKDYLPRYYETTGGLTGSITMTIEYKPITITAPADAVPISSLVPGQ